MLTDRKLINLSTAIIRFTNPFTQLTKVANATQFVNSVCVC